MGHMKILFQKYAIKYLLDSSRSGYGPVARSYEPGNNVLGSIKGCELLKDSPTLYILITCQHSCFIFRKSRVGNSVRRSPIFADTFRSSYLDILDKCQIEFFLKLGNDQLLTHRSQYVTRKSRYHSHQISSEAYKTSLHKRIIY